MIKIPGVNYFHTHPRMETKLGVDVNHVIVDEKDYREVLLALNGDKITISEATFNKNTADMLLEYSKWLSGSGSITSTICIPDLVPAFFRSKGKESNHV